MTDEQRINPRHKEVRRVLRIVGPIMAGIGGLLVVIGVGSFFASFGSFEPPKYFWCAFVGGPLLVIGLGITANGYMGAISRYHAGEMAPVAKDTFNYVANGTQEGVKSIAGAVGAGLSAGMRGGVEEQKECTSCGHKNDTDAKFCDECGQPMARRCPSCDKANDQDAKFCNNCGENFAS